MIDRDYPRGQFADDPRVLADEETIRQEQALLAILLCLTTDDASYAACGVAA